MTGVRAIIDIGLLDVDPQHLRPIDENVNIVGATSDMIVVNLDDVKRKYKVGDFIEFGLEISQLLGLLGEFFPKVGMCNADKGFGAFAHGASCQACASPFGDHKIGMTAVKRYGAALGQHGNDGRNFPVAGC